MSGFELSFEPVLEVEILESVLDLRRLKGREGTRKDGNMDGDMTSFAIQQLLCLSRVSREKRMICLWLPLSS